MNSQKFSFDHIVAHIDGKYQEEKEIIEHINDSGYVYVPKRGKRTKGFRASNIWIGDEYFEMVRLLQPNGGGWTPEWVKRYNEGHKGMICLMLKVDDINALYEDLKQNDLSVTHPEALTFRFLFNLFEKKMPWSNSYVPFFEGAPFQIGFQQMENKQAEEVMRKLTVPNTRENGITGFQNVYIYAPFTENDLITLSKIFGEDASTILGKKIQLEQNQGLYFCKSDTYWVDVLTQREQPEFISNTIQIENIKVS